MGTWDGLSGTCGRDGMSGLASFASAVFWGVLVLSVLVFVHEGGHFVSARAFGMRVTEFFLGLPSRFRISFKSRRHGTEFGVTPLLLGGYNRICGMEQEQDDLLAPALAIVQREGRVAVPDLARELGIDDDRAYGIMACLNDLAAIRPFYDEEAGEHPWQSAWPLHFETLERDANLLTEYDPDHDFATAGTTGPGEPRPVDDQEAFLEHERARTYQGKGFVARVVTLLAGPLVNIAMAFLLLVGSLVMTGIEVNTNSNELGGVTEGSLAQDAGIRAGDRIVMFGGHDVSTWTELVDAIDKSLNEGGDIAVAYERDGQTFETTIVIPDGEKPDLIGVSAKLEVYHPSLVEASSYAFSYMRMVGGAVARIIMPQHTMEVMSQSSSIVGISAMASEAAASGISDFVLFAAAISMSLGFMNLLPIPPLDGGKILIEVVQLVMRRPLSTRAQSIVSYVGLAFFLFIFCFALKNDIVRLLGL